MGTCVPPPARLKQMLLLQLLLLHAPGMWVSKPPHRAEAFCIGIFSTPDIAEPLGSGLHRLCSQRGRERSTGKAQQRWLPAVGVPRVARRPRTQPAAQRCIGSHLPARNPGEHRSARGHPPSNRLHLRERSAPNAYAHMPRSQGRAGVPCGTVHSAGSVGTTDTTVTGPSHGVFSTRAG